MLLPPATARLVLSGKYADAKDPSAKLGEMVKLLEERKVMLAQRGLEKSLVGAKRGGVDPELVRLQAQLAVAQRKGDQELVEQLLVQISKRKQAE